MSLEHPLPRKHLNARGLALTLAGALTGTLLLLLPMLANSADWAGWLFLYLSPCALLAFPEFRTNRRLLVAGLLVLAAHHLIAIFNNYVGIGLFATGDPMNFHREGSFVSRGEYSGYAANIALAEYVYILGFFIKFSARICFWESRFRFWLLRFPAAFLYA